MRHPTGQPFLYFVVAGMLLVVNIFLLPVLHAVSPTFKGLLFAIAILGVVPFIFVPTVVFQFERRWIRHGTATEALVRTPWILVFPATLLATAIALAWMSLPWLLR